MSTTQKMQKRAKAKKRLLCKTNNAIYHYTKGVHIAKIIRSGFLARERECGNGYGSQITNFVWFTEKETYPKTALPNIPEMPETNLLQHFSDVKPIIDWMKLSTHIGGIYRFKFKPTEDRFVKWFDCDYRNSNFKNVRIKMLDSTANMVGDNIKKFWISKNSVSLKNCELEQLINGVWTSVLKFDSCGEVFHTSSYSMEQIVNESVIARQACGLI
jgi:hypothetical protein